MASQGNPAPSRAEIAAVYVAGVVQGIALVAFPACGAIFTSPEHYGLSSTQYGALFVPQAIMAILTSLLGPLLTQRIGAKAVFLAGLFANLLAMGLLIASQFVISDHALAYGTLLVATTSMGVAFGLTVPTINTFAAGFFPKKVDQALLALNTLLGLGTALAPAFVAVFVGFGIWWGLPVVVAVMAAALLLFTLPLPLVSAISSQPQSASSKKAPFPTRFWVFAGVALIYGICETMSGNWASIYMAGSLHANTAMASLALTVFWGMVTVGRLLIAFIDRWFPEKVAFVVLPAVITVAFVVTAFLPVGEPVLGILAFGLAGLGCSAMLPLIISFGQKQMAGIAAGVAGGMIAFYQIGYGIAAFGVGPLENLGHLKLAQIYGGSAFAGIVLLLLSLVVSLLSKRTG